MVYRLDFVGSSILVSPSIGRPFILSMNFLSVVKTHNSKHKKKMKKMTKETTGHISIFSML
jgi:hypothetical protein